jgi:FkbM family methyltransferase
MKFALLRALRKLKASRPYGIQWQYLANGRKEKVFYFTSPFTGKRLKALWSNNQDLREIMLAFGNNKWQKIDLGNPEVIVDLGSNNGYSALYFMDRFPRSTIFLVDLLQSNTLFGSRVFELNGLNGTHINAAISGTDGMLDIDLHPAHSRNRLSSLLDEKQRQLFGFSNRQIKVTARRLSTLAAELGIRRINLLKVDIEGAEQYLIEDIDNWSGFVDAVLLEVHHNIDIAWCERKITGAGYSITKQHGDWYLSK